MTDYDNTNRGAVWPNKKREKDTQPHWTGSLNVEGVEYWVSAWKKADDAKENAPSISFAIRPKDEAQEAPAAEQGAFDDDIPFAWAIVLPLIPAIGVATSAAEAML